MRHKVTMLGQSLPKHRDWGRARLIKVKEENLLKSKQIIAGLATMGIVSGAGLYLSMGVSAQTPVAELPTIESRIANEFNVDETRVAEVFNQHREARHEQRLADKSQKLQEAVDQGLITADQKVAIEQKMADMHQAMTELKEQGVDKDTARQSMRELKQEFGAWLESQEIDLKSIVGHDKGGRRGFGKHFNGGRAL